MKSFFALAPVLVMALSMMALTAFAAESHSDASDGCFALSYDGHKFLCQHESGSGYPLQMNDIIHSNCLLVPDNGATIELDGNPETKCQGLFRTPTIHCMKKATVDFSTMAPKSFFIHF